MNHFAPVENFPVETDSVCLNCCFVMINLIAWMAVMRICVIAGMILTELKSAIPPYAGT